MFRRYFGPDVLFHGIAPFLWAIAQFILNCQTIQALSQVFSKNELRPSFGVPIRGGKANPLRVASGETVSVKRIGISSLLPPGVMEEAPQVGGTAHTQWIGNPGQGNSRSVA